MNEGVKTCTGCGETKPREENFGRDRSGKDGFRSRCKSCCSAASAAWNRRNRDRVEKARKSYRLRHPERAKRNAVIHDRRNKERYPEKAAAWKAVEQALKTGALEKPESCEDCGECMPSRDIHGHHHDYSRPLDVRWLCQACHRAVHAREEVLSR